MGPRTYIRNRRIHHHASKPTAIDKITTTRPYINPQLSSPLFALLPAELRTQIFHYALLASPDFSKPYSKHSYWYRPGYTHARRIATSLLLSCRRVYLETCTLPLALNEHVIWGVERSRIPPGATNNYNLDGRMKLSQRNEITYIHIFCQQFWLEDWKNQWLAFSKSWMVEPGALQRLRITIRHTDWWYNLLGENSPLALDPKRKGRARPGEWLGAKEPFEKGSWGERFRHFEGLRELELELETVEGKRGELDASVEKAGTWQFKLGDGNVLVLDEDATEKSSWIGSKHFKGLNAPAVPPGLQLRQGSRASLSLFASTPRSNSEVEELAPEDSLVYYVVLLTWRARAAPAVKAEDAAKAEEEKTSEDAVEPRTTNSSASADNAPAAAPPAAAAQPTRPSPLFNRFNAPPTYYG